MIEERPSPESTSHRPSVGDYLAYNDKLQKLAWFSVALPILIFVVVVTNGTIRLTHLQHKVYEAKAELASTQNEIMQRQNEIKLLEKKRAAVNQQINNFNSSPTLSTDTAPLHSVSGHRVMISINIADSRNQEEAEQVAKVFRSHGYTVTEIDVKRPNESSHETTVRFFQYDRTTVAIGKDLVALMQSIGFKVRTEFDDEFVGERNGPPPGTYEVWIGTNASYTPPNRTPN
jgi:hypothetical protein